LANVACQRGTLARLGGDIIRTSEWTITLIDDSQTFTTTTIRLAGGVRGSSYAILNRVVNGPREADIRMSVYE
jgi:hypothetical protein